MSWIGYSVRRGILSTRYPLSADAMPATYRGVAEGRPASYAAQRVGAESCLSNAILLGDRNAQVDPARCFQCGQCARRAPEAFGMSDRFELALVPEEPDTARALLRRRVGRLGRSIHIRHVDAGSDGSEEQELQAIFNPFYDANRLGIFLTASPRHADVLIVSGVVTHAMAQPLCSAYGAMPEPKLVIALGTSACSGGIFAQSREVVGKVSDLLPVDVFIPGAPPAPLSILHGMYVALGHLAATGQPA